MILDAIFQDGAVLQAEKPFRVFGKADGKVTVTVGREKQSCVANGRFTLTFAPRPYGDSTQIIARCGKDEQIVRGVIFGDIYLIAGQSNMQFKLSDAKPDGEIYECEDIRLYSPNRIEKNEHFTPEDGWVKCNRSTAPNFSAIGYFVARDLHKLTGKPIGLVSCYQGASIIQSWLPLEVLEEKGLESINAATHNFDRINPVFSAWNKPGKLYDYAFSQIVPYAFKAIIWYQGESNTVIEEAREYAYALKRMVERWRADLLDESLPFVCIQIADLVNRQDEAWYAVQKAQEDAAKAIENFILVKSADICETDDIHPPTKHLLAKRIVNQLL